LRGNPRLTTRPSRVRRRRRPAGRNPQHGRQAPRWRARAWSRNGALATASPCGEASELRRSPLRLHADCRRRPSGRLHIGLRHARRHGREVRHERAFPTCGNVGRSPRRRGTLHRPGQPGRPGNRGGGSGRPVPWAALPTSGRTAFIGDDEGWWQEVPPLRRAGGLGLARRALSGALRTSTHHSDLRNAVSSERVAAGESAGFCRAETGTTNAMLQNGKPRRATGEGRWQQRLSQRTLVRSKALKSRGPGGTGNASLNGKRATVGGDADTAVRVGKALEGMASVGKLAWHAARVGPRKPDEPQDWQWDATSPQAAGGANRRGGERPRGRNARVDGFDLPKAPAPRGNSGGWCREWTPTVMSMEGRSLENPEGGARW